MNSGKLETSGYVSEAHIIKTNQLKIPKELKQLLLPEQDDEYPHWNFNEEYGYVLLSSASLTDDSISSGKNLKLYEGENSNYYYLRPSSKTDRGQKIRRFIEESESLFYFATEDMLHRDKKRSVYVLNQNQLTRCVTGGTLSEQLRTVPRYTISADHIGLK